jgi:CheY-like chemotaxis protein
VLIADDEEPLRQAIRALLEDEGFSVREAQNGAEALDILRAADEPMVVMLDWMMPLVDGAAVLRAAADDPVRLGRHAYILVTALPSERHAELAELLGALAATLLPKPFDITELMDAVERAEQHLAAQRVAAQRPDALAD